MRVCHKMIEFPCRKCKQIARKGHFVLLLAILLCGFLLLRMSIVSVNTVGAKAVAAAKRDTGHGLFRDVHPINRFLLETMTTPQLNVTFPAYSMPMLQTCQKKFNVSFLKVHKAGSTTIMNIFVRFAIQHKLNIVLPRNSHGFGFNYLGYSKTLSKERIVPVPYNQSYNILCNHVIYNRTAFRSVMPSNTMYVGILREPTSHFISAASYYGFYKNLVAYMNVNSPRVNVIHEFLKNPKQYKYIATLFVYNRMSFDFGIPKAKFHDKEFITNYIAELDTDYSLVMMLERFPESLVLLKRTLCWSTKDILYVPLNQLKNKPEFHLADEDIFQLKQWNMADYMLYEHFSRVFDEKVKLQGDDLQEEVKSFINIHEAVKYFCDNAMYSTEYKVDGGADMMTVPDTNWGTSFLVTAYDCKIMTQPELPIMKRLIERAWNKVKHSLKD